MWRDRNYRTRVKTTLLWELFSWRYVNSAKGVGVSPCLESFSRSWAITDPNRVITLLFLVLICSKTCFYSGEGEGEGEGYLISVGTLTCDMPFPNCHFILASTGARLP